MTFCLWSCQGSYFQLSDWSIYLTVLYMIGRSKMNERLPDMTPKGMLLDVCVIIVKENN